MATGTIQIVKRNGIILMANVPKVHINEKKAEQCIYCSAFFSFKNIIF